jgi:hypothetical protein
MLSHLRPPRLAEARVVTVDPDAGTLRAPFIQCRNNSLVRDWQVLYTYAHGVVHGVGDYRSRCDARQLPEPLGPYARAPALVSGRQRPADCALLQARLSLHTMVHPTTPETKVDAGRKDLLQRLVLGLPTRAFGELMARLVTTNSRIYQAIGSRTRSTSLECRRHLFSRCSNPTPHAFDLVGWEHVFVAKCA